jgi:hypothetical protein
VQLKAAGYNPLTGLWTATVGPNAQATGTFPALTASASPNGSPAVAFTGANPFQLASSLPVESGYTVFAYVKPATGAGPYALCGGSSTAFEYRIYNSKQDSLEQQTADLGSETTAMSTSAFNLIDVAVSTNSGATGSLSYRLNGVADGSFTPSVVLPQPISAIGARASSGGENFSGSLCEIDIYPGVLTPSQIAAIENTLSNAYVNTLPTSAPAVAADTTASPNPASVNGNATLSASFTGTAPISYQWQVSPNANGSGAVNIAGATNTTLTLTNLALSAKYYSLQASNGVAPYVTNSSWLLLNVQPLTPLVQLLATNYNPTTGVWTDSTANNNNATYGTVVGGTLTLPNLNTFVTPNGGSAVDITAGNGSFALTTPLVAGSGYTVFTYAEPTIVSNASARYALTGGSAAGALEYNLFQGHQNYLVEYTGGGGSGTNFVPANAFNIFDLAVNSSAGGFRFNGTADGSVAGASFSQPLVRIGNNEGGGDGFLGQIAEVDIYNGALTYIQITNIEAQLTAKYVTANSIVVGPASVSPTNLTYAGNPITLSAGVIGASGTTTFRWQTDNGSGGASFANISGATTTNYVLNTTGLNGTYEYQLIGTPFGGNSVTGAPVSLTVQAPSAPSLYVDTAANPNPASVGGSCTFTASFVGNLPIAYQWQVSPNANGSGAVNIAGATNATLVLNNLQLANSGYYYSLQASNSVAPHTANSTWLQLTVVPLAPLVVLQATNYDAGLAQWNDSSPNGNTAYFSGSTTLPTLVPFVTPNGSSAVNITTAGSFVFSSPLNSTVGYTVFAYVSPTIVSNGSRFALTGGSGPTSGTLEYDFYQGHQNYLLEYVGGGGSGTNLIPTSSFSLVDLAVDSTGGSFRFNGAADGVAPGATFGEPITRVINNQGGGDGFLGQVAEIDIYAGKLTYLQITNIEAQLTAEYATASTVVVGQATATPNNVYAGSPVTLSAPVIGGTVTTTYQWQTDNGSSGASFSNISGATTTNYVLNTSGLAANTYEYQLIATPFGGGSVTSAPVSVTVQLALAPLVANDTTLTPNPATISGNATFSASFTGTLPITYQWQVSTSPSGSPAVNIPGATNITLLLSNLQSTNSGYYYSLQASNSVAPHLANSTWLELTVQPLSAVVQLMATNYNAITGVWTNSSDANNPATYSGLTIPTLLSAVTPDGSPAVDIVGNDGSFVFASPLATNNGYTVFAYVMPAAVNNGNARFALTGGSTSGALEYNFYQGNQDYLIEYVGGGGSGTTTIPTTSFSLVDVAVNSSGASFRFNGTPDGTAPGATFTSPITRVGNNEGGGDGLTGELAELDIYSGALTSQQITNVEAQLTAKYGSIITVATNPTNILAKVISPGTLQLSWPADHIGWRLLVQTNNLINGISTKTNDWTTVPGSQLVDSTNLPIIPANRTEFYRLVYP